MPVKRRTSKRRASPQLEYEAWEPVFDSGYDFFDELPEIGIETDNYSRPPLDLARCAWQRFGDQYLQTHSRKNSRGNPIWAMQFGEPAHAD